MQRLEVLGYWFNPDAPSELPLPQRLVGELPEDERRLVLAYLRAGKSIVAFPEPSFCRFGCDGEAMGRHDLTDGRFVWPEGLAHYVECHRVRLPSVFVAHAVAALGEVKAFAMPKTRFGLYDRSPWLAWARGEGACLALAGFELPDDEVRERIAADLVSKLGVVDYEHILLSNGSTREVVLATAGGGLQLWSVKAGVTSPKSFAGWHEWPSERSDAPPRTTDQPSPAQLRPQRPKPGATMDEFFSALRKRQDQGDGE